MIAMECDELRIIRDGINGRRPADRETLLSMAVLEARLERLRQSNPRFARVTFSPYVQQLARNGFVAAL